jgi:NAD(P)-dependent dehydrogenase (short-subunit alcohol dehydrogenase family)
MSDNHNSDGSGEFAGKVAIITGASLDPSIGRSAATKLGRGGAAVVINARNTDALRAAEADLMAMGIRVQAVPGPADDPAVVTALVDAAVDGFGRVDLIVNTVGGSLGQTSPMTITREALLDTIALNIWAPVSLIQEAVRRGLADGGGAVVNISSGTTHKTTPMMMAYAAGKSALNAITRTLARDLGGQGIRVNGVAPGLTKTSATRPMWEADDGQSAGSNVVLARFTEADDIANAVVFLLSERARQITGVVIDVDGGNHLQGGGWSPIQQTTSAAAT